MTLIQQKASVDHRLTSLKTCTSSAGSLAGFQAILGVPKEDGSVENEINLNEHGSMAGDCKTTSLKDIKTVTLYDDVDTYAFVIDTVNTNIEIGHVDDAHKAANNGKIVFDNAS